MFPIKSKFLHLKVNPTPYILSNLFNIWEFRSTYPILSIHFTFQQKNQHVNQDNSVKILFKQLNLFFFPIGSRITETEIIRTEKLITESIAASCLLWNSQVKMLNDKILRLVEFFFKILSKKIRIESFFNVVHICIIITRLKSAANSGRLSQGAKANHSIGGI